MATIDKFNDHCWKDVVPEADLALYTNWRRDTFVGPRPALLAIDLYNLVYRGGAHSPYELNDRFPMTCGAFAHQAIAPTRRPSRSSIRRRICAPTPGPRAPSRPAASSPSSPVPTITRSMRRSHPSP